MGQLVEGCIVKSDRDDGLAARHVCEGLQVAGRSATDCRDFCYEGWGKGNQGDHYQCNGE